MLNAHETDAAVRALPSILSLPKDARDERVALDRSNREATNGYEAQFKEYLEHTFASEIPEAARGAIFSQAWSYGHSNGYNETQMYYEDLAALVLTALRAR